MISKFKKYWFEFSEMLAIAVILDPHYKLYLVNYYYMKIYGIMDSLQFKSMFEIAVENRAFGYRAFAYELLSKVLFLKSHYMFGNYMS
jgi:hypothetical protein